MSNWCKKAIKLLAVAFGVLMLCLPAFSQGSAGRILGTVSDQSGGTVAGATVSVVDTARGVTRTLTTDDAGEYNAPNLTPGTYTVRAEAKGFKKLERQNIDVGVGKEVRVDLTVQPGQQEQTVTVTEAIPLVETTNATLGGTLDNADINDMPLNGRNFQSLLALRPGVMLQPGGGPWTQSTNGVRPDESAWMIDGVINSNFFDARPIAGMPSPITDGATILPIDAIQEFNLMENPKAEYGWKPGAVVNVGIKSGTNQFHGSVYGFYRSAAWDARNYFNPAPNGTTCPIDPTSSASAQAITCGKLPTQLKQYGAVVGGPIIKDRLFFFGGFEGLNSLIGNAIGSGGIPETGASNGDTTNNMVAAISALQTAGFTSLCSSSSTTASTCLSPVSLAIAGCTGTVTTVGSYSCTGNLFPNNPGNSTGYISNFPNTNKTYNGVGKIDYHINDKNTLNGETVIGNYVGTGEDHPFINSIYLDNFIIKTYTASGTWDYTPNSSLVNEVRFGYNRMDFITATNDAGATVAGLTPGTSTPGLPTIAISGFNNLGTWHNRPQSIAPNPYYDFQDSISYLKGKHTLKFGFEYAHIEADSYIPDYGRGQVGFTGGGTLGGLSTSLEDFFAGQPGSGKILVGNPTRSMTWTNTAGFVQDDYRASPKFTLNVGLRYEFKSPIKAAHNLWANFDPTSSTGLIQQGQPGENSIWKPDPKDFSPRAGFAWDIKGNGNTVVRGGFSVMYSTFTAVMWMNQNQFQNTSSVSLAANPTGADIYVGGVKIFSGAATGIQVKAASQTPTPGQWNGVIFPPVAAGTNLTCKDTSPCSLMAVDPNLQAPYIMNFNLGIQHAFGNNLSLEVGYVGNHGARLTGFADINAKPLGGGARPYSARFPWLKYINYMSNDTRSNYNSLQATLTKRMSHGLSLIAGYTYAHGLDNGSLNRFGLIPQNSNDPGAEYGNSDFDVRHRLTITTTYNIPGIKGFAQLLEGWQVNGIVTLQSSQPWTVNDYNNNFSGAGDSADRWDFIGNPSDFKGTRNSIPFCSGFGATVSCSYTDGQSTQSIALPNSIAAACTTAAAAHPEAQLGGGCFVSGTSVMLAPAAGTFGTMGRNIFRDSGFRNLDFSVFKNFRFKERYGAQFRLEMFNVFNHPIFANPYGASSGSSGGQNDPSTPGAFGGTSGTPDVNAGNPLVGSGAARDLQVGLKLTF